MLVLTRKTQQQIRVGEHIVITILRVKGQAVRVGIDAPKNVRVVRAELPLLPELQETELSIDIAPLAPVSARAKVMTDRPTPKQRRQEATRAQSAGGDPSLSTMNPVDSQRPLPGLSFGLASKIARRESSMESTGRSETTAKLGAAW